MIIAALLNKNLNSFMVKLLRWWGNGSLADQIHPHVPADPDDDIVIACAIAGQATHLVTYDSHLLDLGEMYQGVAIIDGLRFLYTVREDEV